MGQIFHPLVLPVHEGPDQCYGEDTTFDVSLCQGSHLCCKLKLPICGANYKAPYHKELKEHYFALKIMTKKKNDSKVVT